MNAGKNKSTYVSKFSRACKRNDYGVHNDDFASSVQECKYLSKMVTEKYLCYESKQIQL